MLSETYRRGSSGVTLSEPIYVDGPKAGVEDWELALKASADVGRKIDRTSRDVGLGLTARGAFTFAGEQRRPKVAALISEDSGLPVRTVKRHMTRLRERGWLSVMGRVSVADGLRSTAMHQLHTPFVLVSTQPSTAAVEAMTEWKTYGTDWEETPNPWLSSAQQAPAWATAKAVAA